MIFFKPSFAKEAYNTAKVKLNLNLFLLINMYLILHPEAYAEPSRNLK